MKRNCLLILAFIIITAVPFFISNGADFEGADGQAEDVITAIHPDYKPWADFIWEPASGEIESLLFALQAAIGAAVIAYFVGLARGKNLRQRERQ